MTFLSEDHNILKSDNRGRVRVPAERREALLDEFERSGLSGVKFAALAGVKYPTFALWAQKRRKAREQGAGEAPRVEGLDAQVRARPIRLFEAVAEVGVGGSTSAGLTIELPGGARVRVESPRQLRLGAELLRLIALQGGRPC
jgi:hypothetical protein